MRDQLYYIISGTIFAGAALIHLGRLTNHWTVTIGTWTAPLWLSVVGMTIAGTLSVWAFRLASRKNKK